MPWINLIIAYIMKYLFIFMDNGCTKKIYKTKCKSLAGYKALYIGPDFQAHFAYSNALISIFTAFFYGIQMPILFPIAGFALFNTLITDKIMMAYYYSLPPSMSNKLNNDILNKL